MYLINVNSVRVCVLDSTNYNYFNTGGFVFVATSFYARLLSIEATATFQFCSKASVFNYAGAPI